VALLLKQQDLFDGLNIQYIPWVQIRQPINHDHVELVFEIAYSLTPSLEPKSHQDYVRVPDIFPSPSFEGALYGNPCS
jgi:hypothetical protein